MDYEHFLERVREHTGLAERVNVELVVGAVMEALGPLVEPAHREALASELPAALARRLCRGAPDPSLDQRDFLRRVSASVHLPEGPAREQATAVLEALGDELEPEPRRLLAMQLPGEMPEWLTPRRVSGARGEHGTPSRRQPGPGGHRLSDARPGSRHPLSEAAPTRAHSGSVAASDDPHRDTRLSTARGLTQEREHEDLAEGHPGSDRPLDEAGD
jgi:uncharacterized protein (DUF2267 family)